MEAPSCPYKIQPENQGKLVWLSGPPGVGKSTTGQLLSKKANYVYYEVDCLTKYLNPFVPLDIEEPSMAVPLQEPIKMTSKEFIESKQKASIKEKFKEGKMDEVTPEEVTPFNETIAKEIDRQENVLEATFWLSMQQQHK